MTLRLNHRQANQEAYKAMAAMQRYTSNSSVDKVPNELIKIRASQINGCAFCLDMHTKKLLMRGNRIDSK